MTDSNTTDQPASESLAPAPLKDVTRVLLPDGREVHLVGTAHVSRESVEAVRAAVEALGPDCVCVELDADRLQNLLHPTKWDALNLSQAFRQGKGTFLLANLVLAAFQRKLGLHTGIRPGAELAEAVTVAEEREVPAVLVDRNIRITLVRAWRRTGFWKKMWLISSLAASAFDDSSLGEEELAELRQRDTLSVVLEEMGKILPSIKEILIDERDRYMAAKIRRAEGKKIVAVVGAGHVPGITLLLGTEIGDDEIEALDRLPPQDIPLPSHALAHPDAGGRVLRGGIHRSRSLPHQGGVLGLGPLHGPPLCGRDGVGAGPPAHHPLGVSRGPHHHAPPRPRRGHGHGSRPGVGEQAHGEGRRGDMERPRPLERMVEKPRGAGLPRLPLFLFRRGGRRRGGFPLAEGNDLADR